MWHSATPADAPAPPRWPLPAAVQHSTRSPLQHTPPWCATHQRQQQRQPRQRRQQQQRSPHVCARARHCTTSFPCRPAGRTPPQVISYVAGCCRAMQPGPRTVKWSNGGDGDGGGSTCGAAHRAHPYDATKGCVCHGSSGSSRPAASSVVLPLHLLGCTLDGLGPPQVGDGVVGGLRAEAASLWPASHRPGIGYQPVAAALQVVYCKWKLPLRVIACIAKDSRCPLGQGLSWD